ncbi:MAG: hypothetical protein WC867_00570 [Candidatus Pacearchaeota archaeon]
MEIPVINVDLNVDKFKPENLVWGDKYDKKKDKKKIYKILAYLAIIAALIIFFRFALLAYLYIANLPKINSYDANIERIALSDDGKQAYIKLTGGNSKEIESIKFIFRTNESEYIYETTDGIKEITYEDKRFLTYFANPEYEGSYDYSIKSGDIGLEDFRGIIKVEVLIRYKDEKSGEIKETKIVDSTKKSDIKVVSGGYSGGGGSSGGSGGGSGGGDNNPTCTPSCSGKNCGDNGCGGTCGICNDNNECTDESCNSGSCSFVNKSDGSICSSGTCKSGRCVSCQSDSECNDNINCTTDKCTLGRCEITTNNNLCTNGNICDRFYGCVPEIHITQEWLNSKGKSPYYLDTAGAKYILETDVVTNGTAFVIIANNIDFNLNSHTIIYNNQEPPYIENNDFQNGNSGWDLTNTPNAIIGNGSFVNLNEYKEDRALRFLVPANDQYVTSLNKVNLEPNTNYTLYARIYEAVNTYGQPSDEFARAIVSLVGRESVNITYATISNRGVAFLIHDFSTGNSPESYNLRISLENALKTKNDTLYIEEVGITRASSPGIVMGPVSWRAIHYPEVNRYAYSHYSSVRNGVLIQGNGNSDFSNGITITRADNSSVSDMIIKVHGPDSRNIYGASNVINNRLYNDVKVISSRDYFDGTVINGGVNITNNIIYSGCQNGIIPSHNSFVFNNSITLQSRYTNGYAIQGYGNFNSTFIGNIINCGSGNNSCRGIYAGSEFTVNKRNVKILNNIVEIQELPRVQEYSGCQGGSLSGAYGIQLEAATDVIIRWNNISAIARECPSAAFRRNGNNLDKDIIVENNIFNATRYSSSTSFNPVAKAFFVSSGVNNKNETLLFRNNILITNHRFISSPEVTNLEFYSNTFIVGDNKEEPFQPFVSENYQGYAVTYYPKISNIKFIDNKYQDEYVANVFKNASIYKKFYVSMGLDKNCSFYYSWTTNLSIIDSNNNPLSGVNVIIRNALNQEIYNGYTESNGLVSLVLDEFYYFGGNKTNYNPYTIQVSKNGYDTYSKEFYINNLSEIKVVLQ